MALLLAGCGHRADEPVPATGKTTIAAVAAADAAARPTPAEVLLPPDREGNPACPPTDAWGRDVSDGGTLVTVWSDHADVVTVLVRTKSGVDRAKTERIGPHDGLRLFEFPDVAAETVSGVLILTNTRRCYSMMDPATG
ncbi:hypothetical protein [Mycobacterium hubeiense]|uniref:hypothetical protein n=1 Tax=Mycobacterium hubeiense TaxID=1867256 RepID=UPI00115A3804|nr:hypothetical protein [Mycobacterium sp. QGD 101]